MRSRYLETVHIIVDPEKQDFSVHKSLLCQRSKFFHAAFNGCFAETSKCTIELLEEDSAIFDIVLITWLYEGQLTEPQNGRTSSVMSPCSSTSSFPVTSSVYETCGRSFNKSLQEGEWSDSVPNRPHLHGYTAKLTFAEDYGGYIRPASDHQLRFILRQAQRGFSYMPRISLGPGQGILQK
ncbi:hypothetical protein ABVK25_009514 [Lepraria finkii]|uniref:BTB domain-containing protein n=1 Tax=Lepraria finkii TaxID=1340010 RepID=A0ABR4B2Z8_9LECA